MDYHTDKLLTREEIARQLSVHPLTILRHEKAGRIPAVRIGRAVRYDLAAVRDALSVNKTKQDKCNSSF